MRLNCAQLPSQSWGVLRTSRSMNSECSAPSSSVHECLRQPTGRWVHGLVQTALENTQQGKKPTWLSSKTWEMTNFQPGSAEECTAGKNEGARFVQTHPHWSLPSIKGNKINIYNPKIFLFLKLHWFLLPGWVKLLKISLSCRTGGFLSIYRENRRESDVPITSVSLSRSQAQTSSADSDMWLEALLGQRRLSSSNVKISYLIDHQSHQLFQTIFLKKNKLNKFEIT